MNLSQPFIERPIATSLLVLALVLVGIAAYPLLPVSPLPQVEFPTLQVTAALPGASPETMASSVATPLERQFSQIPGIKQMSSSSALGLATVNLQFELTRNIDAAAQDVQAAINAASGQLPKDLPTPPIYHKVNPADPPVLILSVNADNLPITVLDDFADTVLAEQMSQISGVSQVAISGEQKPAIRVQVDPARLAGMGLSLEDVRLVLANATTDSPKGSFNGRDRNLAVYANDQLTTAAPWNKLIIAYRNGAPVRISDIGQAVDGPENTQLSAWQNGRRGIQLIVSKLAGANAIDTADRVKAALPRLLAAMPPGIEVGVVIDRTQTIRASVKDVQLTMLATIGLVVLVIFVFLRSLWATLIPSITIPISIVGTFTLMYAMGYSIDNLSLMAMTIAIGFVVDDAIVMQENIHRHIEAGLGRLAAAIKGAGEIGFTILSISISLVAVFIPLLLMSGIVGRLFREFAITVTMTILVSTVVSLTLTPMLCARFLKPQHAGGHGRFYQAVESVFDQMVRGYDHSLRWALRHPVAMLLLMVGTMVLTGALYVKIPKGFFPQQDTGYIFGNSDAAQDISFTAMVRKQLALAAIVAQDPDIASYSLAVGPTGGSQTVNNGRFWMGLKPRDQRGASADEIIRRLKRKAAAVSGVKLLMQVPQDLSVGARTARTQYQYTLQDPDLAELDLWAKKLFDRFGELPEIQDVASDQQAGAAAVTLDIDRDAAARFGIQPQLIDDTLYDAIGQRQVAQYFTQRSQYHVILEIDPALQADPANLSQLYVSSPDSGANVPLSTFASFDTGHTGYLSINHQGQLPSVTLSFNLAPGVALGQAVDAIDQAQRAMNAPAALLGTFQGTAQAFQESLRSQPYLILAAIVAVYIVLGVLYESYIHPVTILSTLPSAGVGALLILMLSGRPLDIIGIVGIILLIGIVKKNAIMMIDFALHAERHEKLSPREAIHQACLVRFRPIMMTTMAALLGALPLMLGRGTGSELRQPLGLAMVGGLLLSQVLTLYTTPVVYLAMDRLERLMGGQRTPPRTSSAQRLLGAGRPEPAPATPGTDYQAT